MTREPDVVEKDRLPSRKLGMLAIIAIVVTIVAVFISDRILRASSTSSPVHPTVAPEQIGIVEQSLIWTTQRGLDERARQRESLRHAEWIDRDAGIARIPIDRAISQVIERAQDRDGGP
jgi:hypothetical protein